MKKFTLVELLVVIAIIGILLSMLMPSLRTAREKMKRTVCLNNQSQIYKGQMMFSDSYDEKIPIGSSNYFQFNYTISRGEVPYYSIFGSLFKTELIESKLTFYCPSKTSESHTYDSEKNKWDVNSGKHIRSAYSSRPVKVWDNGIDYFNEDYPDLPKITDFDNQVIMTDVLFKENDMNDCHFKGVNMTNINGSTRFIYFSSINDSVNLFKTQIKNQQLQYNANYLNMWTEWDETQ